MKQNNLIISIISVSVLLISFSVFLSVANNMYAKAQGIPITGHIVLYEGQVPAEDTRFTVRTPYALEVLFLGTQVFSETLFLPGTDCVAEIKCCDAVRTEQCSSSASGGTLYGLIQNSEITANSYGKCFSGTVDDSQKSNYEYTIECNSISGGSDGVLNHVSLSYKC